MEEEPVMKVTMEDGREIELSFEELCVNLYQLVKLFYFDCMHRCKDATVEEFKVSFFNILNKCIDTMDSKYADHLEGRRKKIFGDQAVNE